MKSIRCSECGERIISPAWWDGKPYCTMCAIRKRTKKHIEEVRRRNAAAKNSSDSRK